MVPIKRNLASKENYGGQRTKPIQWIVMHYTANDGDSDESNANYFKTTITKSSAHYFVDDDSITVSVPDEYIAWHCGTANGAYQQIHPECTNSNSIGIEMCDTTKNGVVMVSDRTLQNAVELAAMLCAKYQIQTDHIIRHYDVTRKICPAYWVADESGLLQFRARVQALLDETEKPEQKPEEPAQDLTGIAGTGDNPSDWAKNACEWAKKNGIFGGDGNGNYGWQKPITREAVAVVLYRLLG